MPYLPKTWPPFPPNMNFTRRLQLWTASTIYKIKAYVAECAKFKSVIHLVVNEHAQPDSEPAVATGSSTFYTHTGGLIATGALDRAVYFPGDVVSCKLGVRAALMCVRVCACIYHLYVINTQLPPDFSAHVASSYLPELYETLFVVVMSGTSTPSQHSILSSLEWFTPAYCGA